MPFFFHPHSVSHFCAPRPVRHHRGSLHSPFRAQGGPSVRRGHVGKEWAAGPHLLLQPGRATPAAVVHGHGAAVATAPGGMRRRVVGRGHHEPGTGLRRRVGGLEVFFLGGKALEVAHEPQPERVLQVGPFETDQVPGHLGHALPESDAVVVEHQAVRIERQHVQACNRRGERGLKIIINQAK